MSAIRRALDALCAVVTFLLKLMMLGMLIIMVSLVVTRYFFDYSPGWSEEGARFMLVWSVLLGAAVLVLFEDHIALHLFTQELSPGWARAQRMLCHLAVGLPSALICWKGIEFAQQMASVTAPGTQWPMTVPTLAIPLATGLMALFTAVLMVRDVLALPAQSAVLVPLQSAHMDTSFKPASDDGNP